MFGVFLNKASPQKSFCTLMGKVTHKRITCTLTYPIATYRIAQHIALFCNVLMRGLKESRNSLKKNPHKITAVTLDKV